MRQQVSSAKKLGRSDALELASNADSVIASKGTAVQNFDLKRNKPDQEELCRHMLGPTGNLRAPTIRAGKLLLVGFNADVYAQHLR